MRRKLIKQGNDALTVTIPAKWLKSKNLKSGDEIEINEQEQNLLISGTGDAELKTKQITLENVTQNHLRSLISSAYKAGYDQITIKSKEPLKLSLVNEVINTFTGLEVVSEDRNTIMIKSFLRPAENTGALIVKLFQITKLVVNELDENWNKVDINNLEVLINSNLRKLRDHCLRNIHLQKFGGDKSYDYYDLVTIIEKIAAEFLSLAKIVCKEKKAKDKIFFEIKKLFEESYFVYLKKDYLLANKHWLNVGKAKDKITKENANYYHLIKLYRHLSSRLVSLSS